MKCRYLFLCLVSHVAVDNGNANYDIAIISDGDAILYSFSAIVGRLNSQLGQINMLFYIFY